MNHIKKYVTNSIKQKESDEKDRNRGEIGDRKNQEIGLKE